MAWFIGAFIFFFVEIVNSDNRERTGLMACTIAVRGGGFTIRRRMGWDGLVGRDIISS